MHPMVIVAIPLVLVIAGMVLNSMGLSFDQPPSSQEQDPEKRAAAEGQAYRRFFDLQRQRAVARQKRVGQCLVTDHRHYRLLHLAVHVYLKATTATTRIAELQTLAMEEGKQTVLSVTLKDGSNVKYLIKSPTAETLAGATKEGVSKQKVSTYDMEQSGTLLSIGDSPLPIGVTLKVSIDPTAKKD